MMNTLSRKNLMALSGLFLCLFLVIHLAGNLQLLLPQEKAAAQFNLYSRILSGNLLIKVISCLLFLSIGVHAFYAWVITRHNQQARGVSYAYDQRKKLSSWPSRNMGLLGSILFLFIIIHLKDFWYQYTFGELPIDAQGNKDLFTIVVEAYLNPWYVGLNIVAFLALGFHLWHGFYSAFKSLGAYPSKISKAIYVVGIVFTLILTLGFILIPIYVFFNYS